ncbi:SDR family NAD(P)-dependent oxidoreductase [Microbacterium sp. ZW T2_14]|uniref:SDR family NAD(P)-dependent oxidoreductase n=1 Tax=Microbacterium sp. ZW T2_14 TaxID=3378079 RepID=UPI0038549716
MTTTSRPASPSRTRLATPLTPPPDLTGRRAVVTGGTSGLGLVTARSFASWGAAVVVGARDVERAGAVRRRLLDDLGLSDDRVTVAPLDLLDLDSVDRFARVAAAAPVDLLVLNAATSSVPFRTSREGIESQFATNHLGHFALTGHLLDQLEAGRDARVVTVSSALYTRGALDLDHLRDAAGYSPGRGYLRAKLANTMFAVDLERRLRRAGSGIRSYAAHPGMARTPLHGTYPSATTRAVTALLARAIGREPEPADAGILTAATGTVTPDLFWGPVGSKTRPDIEGVPFAPVATDERAADRLWNASMALSTRRYLAD